MKILYSLTSSDGNCTVIESGNGRLLVIDAGIKYRTVDRAIGYSLHKADALLITHEHSDHTQYIKDFSNIEKIYSPIECAKSIYKKNSFRTSIHIKEFNTESIFLNGFIVAPLEMIHTNHDGSNCECYGFLIGDIQTKEKLLWATDTQCIQQKFPPLDYYCIESNFFESDFSQEDLNYIEKSVEFRRMQSHMSFETAVKFLKNQDLSKCKEIRLLHISNSLSNAQKENMRNRVEEFINMEGIKVVY